MIPAFDMWRWHRQARLDRRGTFNLFGLLRLQAWLDAQQ